MKVDYVRGVVTVAQAPAPKQPYCSVHDMSGARRRSSLWTRSPHAIQGVGAVEFHPCPASRGSAGHARGKS